MFEPLSKGEYMLEVKEITGGYAGLSILKNISFTVPDAHITGLIGLNGAGKSTTIKEIIGLLTPYEGEISIDGLTFKEDNKGYRKRLAYIPETPNLYEELTLQEHLDVVTMAYDCDKLEAQKKAADLLEMFQLADKLEWFPIHFSKGMQQKVMIVSALMLDADVLVIDEPFIGLDPIAIKHLTDILLALKDAGKTIIVSTHVLDRAEKICDSFVFLRKGQVLIQGDLLDLQERAQQEGGNLEELYLSLVQEGEL